MSISHAANHATTLPAADLKSSAMPGHWLLARMGKKVLRPGGVELTNRMLRALGISTRDQVVEFAPGMAHTARKVLALGPATYTAVEQDPAAARGVSGLLQGPRQKVVQGNAGATGLPDECATVVYAEAMLTMQRHEEKQRIVAEASRLLKKGGRYGIHEISLTESGQDNQRAAQLSRSLATAIHHGVMPLSREAWKELLAEAGLRIVSESYLPMRLLEPSRIIRDEGLLGALRFAKNVLLDGEGRKRVLCMRSMFRRHANDMQAIMLVAEKV